MVPHFGHIYRGGLPTACGRVRELGGVQAERPGKSPGFAVARGTAAGGPIRDVRGRYPRHAAELGRRDAQAAHGLT